MRLLKLELKRVLKSRITVILLLAILAISAFMAYIPITFSYVTVWDEQGEKATLLGLDAIAFDKQVQSVIAGPVTPALVREALTAYQECLAEYGVETTRDLPDGVYIRRLYPYSPLFKGIREVFADPKTGLAPSLLDVQPEQLDGYYDAIAQHLSDLMKLEQPEHPAAQAAAEGLFRRVQTPYVFYPGYNSDAMDYQMLTAFLVLLLCAVITAPVFASDYQTGADDILRCTKLGRLRLAVVKISAALLISAVAFCISAGMYLVISDSLYGWACTKISIQLLFSIVNLPNMSLWQLQLTCAAGYLLTLLATVSLTLLLSSRFHSVVSALAVSLLLCILPVVVCISLPEPISNWLLTILPAGGAALQGSLLYKLIDFSFLHLGKASVWMPFAMAAALIVEIPLFLYLAARSYCRHKIK